MSRLFFFLLYHKSPLCFIKEDMRKKKSESYLLVDPGAKPSGSRMRAPAAAGEGSTKQFNNKKIKVPDLFHRSIAAAVAVGNRR